MNIPAFQTASIACPNCRHTFVTPIMTLIDTSQNPQAKSLLLSGRLNVAVCPQCGHAGTLSTPLVYHDPEKELLFTFVPSELGLADAEQQRIVGDLTNRVMSSLPTEQRKGYLLRPRSFFRLEAMIEAILEADGITPEMLQAQRDKANLLDRLVRAPSEEARKAIAQENDELIDYEFFQLLTLNLELLQGEGQEEQGRQLLELRQQLLDWTTTGQDVAAREDALRELGTEITREELLEKLVEAALAGQEAKVETMVAVARPVIDYLFYQQLTERIEAAKQAGDTSKADTLQALRETILNLTAEIDAEVQKARAEAAELLEQIIDSDDLEQAVRANLEHVDELFLSVLAANLHAAEQSGRTEEAEKLEQVGDILMNVIEESQPPEIRLINQLLNREYPDGTQSLLEERREEISTQLVELMRLVGEDLEKRDREETAQRLAKIREQAEAMLG